MRFTVRPGSDPIARADATILSAMGLPGGGAAKIGRTHVLVRPGDVSSPASLELGPVTMENVGASAGAVVEVTRATLPQARRVVTSGKTDLDPRHLARALQGIPITKGDIVVVYPSYGEEHGEPDHLRVLTVEPGGAGLVGNATVVAPEGVSAAETVIDHPAGRIAGEAPTTADALLAGLDAELDTLTGWLSLLTSAADLPAAWGLPRVAGVLLEGPAGCGKSELVAAAASRAGASVEEVSLELVFKPERLLDLLEKAVKNTAVPAVLFVDRLDAVAGDEGMFRTQVAAIMRWFLDAVSERQRLACVLGVSSVVQLDDAIATSELLPRTLSIPPPDLERRRLLLEAALHRVPTDDLDFEALAARTAGFSGADVLSAAVHASAMIAGGGGALTTERMLESIAGTTPSLGTVPTG